MLGDATAGVEDLLQRAERLGICYISESQLDIRTTVSRETTSFLAERKVFGRDVEKDHIIGWLTRETEAPLSSFSIVGVGGLGKTTLAQSVYQELSKADYFEKTIWVCVSTNFSVKVITEKILGLLGEECNGDNSLEVLQQKLGKKIHSKKIFLILDDVWEDKERRDLEQLIAPLRCAQQGSKILFTTRQKSVADLLASVISAEHEPLALRDLKEQQLRLIFTSYAFHSPHHDAYGDLQTIGDQIIKKLHGNPLAARVIGSLFRDSCDPNYWRRILEHDSLINLEQANEVMEVLKLSYYNLPADLQVCFRFCSIFPEDHRFLKEDLIKMWMASGFLRQKSGEQKRPEDIGEDYFNILLKKSFFEVSKGNYVMHDLIHELATNVSKGECCRVGPNDKLGDIPSTVRHVSVHESEIQKVSHLENVRSLVITTCQKQDETDPNFVLPNNLVKKSLRLLKINVNRCCKLQEEFSSLVHLRYLSIGPRHYPSFQHIIHAPIYKLYHLLVLEVDGSEDSGIETISRANLVSLRYIQLHDRIMKTISGVHMMTSVQELTFYVGRQSGHGINELRTLNNLRHLTIFNVENIRDPVEARSANLLEMKNLRSLELICNSDETNLDNPEEIFDNLQPHQNLMELKIKNYKGQRFPMWMRGDMPHLSTFKLYQCPNLNNQSSFGQMPHLKILHIRKCPNINILPDIPLFLTDFTVSEVGLTAVPSFSVHSSTQPSQTSSLRYVSVHGCPNLIRWDGFLQQVTVDLRGLKKFFILGCRNLAQIPMHAFRTCVSLNQLVIRNCPKLTSVPCPKLTTVPCPPLSLVRFEIDGIGASTLPEYFESCSTCASSSSGGPSPPPPSFIITPSRRSVHISNCPNLTALDGFFQRERDNITQIRAHHARNEFGSLFKLEIRGCPKLIELSLLQQAQNADQGSNAASSLKIEELEIDQLSLLLIEPLRSLRSVCDLTVSQCSRMDALPEQWLMQNSSTLRYLTIRDASTLRSLPATMSRLTALENLRIYNVDLLVELPDLPASLKERKIKSSDGADKF